MNDFSSRRRQPFLDEAYFKWMLASLDDRIAYWSENIAPTGETEDQRKATTQLYRSSDCYHRFLLMYTGGIDIGLLRLELESVVDAFTDYAKALRLYEDDVRQPPLAFSLIGDYENVMQLLGFCYLMHRRDLLPRIVELFDPAYRGTDTLYEDLLAYEFEGRIDVDSWWHDVPYRPLVFSFYRETKAECVADIKEYLEGWYPGMAAAPGHDSHLEAKKGGKGAYAGYWAIEAAAAAYLLQLDDSSFHNHLLYPKDLANFARTFEAQTRT